MINFRLFLKRDSRYWLWNVMILTALINTTLFAQFAIESSNVGDRIQYGAGILLANAGVKYAISERLPTLPYLTFLDVYLLLVTLFNCVTILEPAMIVVLVDEANRDAVDSLCAKLLFLIWAYFHIRVAQQLQTRNILLDTGAFKARKWGHSKECRQNAVGGEGIGVLFFHLMLPPVVQSLLMPVAEQCGCGACRKKRG